MDKLESYRDIIEQILREHAAIPFSYGEITQSVIIDAARNHFLLFNEGWQNQHRVHGNVVHVEIRTGKIWIHYDGIEDGITHKLVAMGVPKEDIVLAFHAPEIRQYTGYALA
ncbi:XisI protein [Chamaesiphon sp. VAR_48_metabat_403]|uniref:XisI protein n=1 Tax=Chamaesiphon sp. VAR_48_metabat_403 TaxID=2964700 RepID=UPI00286DBD48|nr:XisI protein [Chamaesiphon sp. VAR_48_metabat_403]